MKDEKIEDKTSSQDNSQCEEADFYMEQLLDRSLLSSLKIIHPDEEVI